MACAKQAKKSKKTLIAIPSWMEWKVLFPHIPYKATVQNPHPLSANADASCVGIGLVDFASGLSRLIYTQKYNRIILAGVAGALPEIGLSSGDIVRVDEECAGDIGYWNEDAFRPYFKRPHIDKATPSKLAPESIAKLPGVRGISVNTMTASKQALEFRARFFKAKVEAMEGATAFVIANAFGIQIFEVRTISNFTGDLDESKWNLKQSLKTLQQQILNPILEGK